MNDSLLKSNRQYQAAKKVFDKAIETGQYPALRNDEQSLEIFLIGYAEGLSAYVDKFRDNFESIQKAWDDLHADLKPNN